MKEWINVKDAYPEHGQTVWYAWGISRVAVWAGMFHWVTDTPEVKEALGMGPDEEYKIDSFSSAGGFLSCGDVRWWAPRIEGEAEPEPPAEAKPMFPEKEA